VKRFSLLLVAVVFAAPVAHSAPIPAVLVPYEKLNSNKLSRADRAILPDIAVAVATIEIGQVLSCALSSDGKLAVGTDQGAVVLWDLTGEVPLLIANLRPEIVDKGNEPPPRTAQERDRKSVWYLGFTPDGGRLAFTLADSVYVWEITAKSAKFWNSHKVGVIQGLAVSPDGKKVVCGAVPSPCSIFDMSGRTLTKTKSEFNAALVNLTFSPDGKLFASSIFNPKRNGDLYGSEVRLWNLSKEEPDELDLLTLDSGVTAIAFSPDVKILATSNPEKKANKVSLWDLTVKPTTLKTTMTTPETLRNLGFTPDGETLIAISYGYDILLYDVAKGKQRKAWTFEPHLKTDFASSFGYFRASAITPDGKHIAVSHGNTKTVILRLPGKDEPKKEEPGK
jgi:WD40 repeat protein